MTESTLNKEIGQRIKNLRKQQKMTLKEIGAHVGISESTAKRYEDGSIKKISIDIVKKFAVALECPPAYLMGWEDARRPEPSATKDAGWLSGREKESDKISTISDISNIVPITKKKIPLIGTIAAGQPITADEHIEMLLPCVEKVRADFALRVQGDSMIGAGIYDGDIVFICKQPGVDNGQIAAVLIDDSATLKHVYKTPDRCTLVSENPKSPPIVFNESNCDTLRIIGLAVAKYSRIKQ